MIDQLIDDEQKTPTVTTAFFHVREYDSPLPWKSIGPNELMLEEIGLLHTWLDRVTNRLLDELEGQS
jgi:hypothetical protein